MRNESFYTTIAQVLPTIFIAVVIELRALVVNAATRWEEAALNDRNLGRSREVDQRFRRFQGSWWFMVVAACSFIVGEFASLTAIFAGVEVSWIHWAAWLIIASVVTLTLIAVAALAWVPDEPSARDNRMSAEPTQRV